MKKAALPTTVTTVQDPKSGRVIAVKGAGALKGKMTISKKVDLTKPLTGSGQAAKWAPGTAAHHGNLAAKPGISDRPVAKR